MANQKPKKSGKKPEGKPETVKKDAKVEKVAKDTTVSTAKKTDACPVANCEQPMKGFFARKCDANENILTIFKTPKIWGALLGEVIGTMFLTIFFLMLGVSAWPLYFVFCAVAIYTVVVGISGAHLNPLVTAGMMATRRVSAIRGILYMLAQLLGAWIALIILNAFRLAGDSLSTLPILDEVSGETFWAVALVELIGAIMIGFFFARAIRFARKQPLTFAFAVASGITLAIVFGIVVSQNYFAFTGNTFTFNPVVALMYQVLPTTANDFGELAQLAGLALAAYVIFPIIGGILGFYLSDITTRLSCGGYLYECDGCHHEHGDKEKK